MRICDIKEEDIYIGLRLKSLSKPRNGTVVSNDKERDNTFWI